MNNTLPTQYNYPPTCIATNAKYDRDTELAYKDFSLKSQKCQSETTVPCVIETV